MKKKKTIITLTLAVLSVLIIIVLSGCSFNIGPLSVDISRRGKISRELNEKQFGHGMNGFKSNGCCNNYKKFNNFKELKNPADMPFLGILMMQSKDASGAVVAKVIEASPAQKAGLKPGDTITSFDGKEVKEPRDLLAAVMSHTSGDNIKLTIARDGQVIELTVTLAL